jgi:hypothetical protein
MTTEERIAALEQQLAEALAREVKIRDGLEKYGKPPHDHACA